MKFIKKADPEIYSLIKKEEKRQQETLMMIPSENIASAAVEEAVGSVLGNKYAEGYYSKRYYQGQEFVDQIEKICMDRAKELFGVPYVNVQPYSGSPANTAVYFALLNPGDKIMGLALASGGHLTHGVPQITFSGKYHKGVQYTVGKNGWLDYDALEKQVIKEKPNLIVAGITHYPRKLDFKRFAEIAEKVGAILMADISHISGLVVTGAYPNPVPYVHVFTTTTHKTLRGPRGAMIMVTSKGLKRDPEMGDKINKAVFPGLQGGPHMNTIAGLAIALKEASKKSYVTYAHQIVKNAKALADELMKQGLTLLTDGTDSHVMVIDLRGKKILGNTIAEAMEAAGIVANRNSVPFDTNPPFYPSGIRLGTPGLTSRGMKEKQMKQIASWITKIIEEVKKTKELMNVTPEQEKKRLARQEIIDSTPIIKDIRKKVRALCAQFPIKKAY